MAQLSTPVGSSSGGLRGQVRSLPPWGKALLGCGVGCLGVAVIGVILFSIAAYYAVSPGEQIETQRIVGSESQAVFRLDGSRPDSQVGPFLTMVLTEVQKADRQRQNMPGPLRWLAETNDARQAEEIEQWAALQATITFEEGRDEPEAVAAVNLPFYARMLRWTVGTIADPISHDGFDYYRFSERDRNFVSFAENTLIWAEDEQALRTVLERLASDQPAPPPAVFEDALQRLHGQWDFYGISLGSVSQVFDEPELQSVQRWDLGVAASGEDSVQGRLTFRFRDAQTAQQAEPLIEAKLRERQDGWRLEGLTSTYQLTRAGSDIEVDFTLFNMRIFVRDYFSELQDPESRR